MTRKTVSLLAGLLAFPLAVFSQDSVADWYPVSTENKPFVRWWWLGSAVDREGLTYNLEQFAAKGIGGVEITPIYGVQGNEANDIDFLSPEWMEMYRFVCDEGKRLGIEVDMNCGTGWPFGGPGISERYAAKKMEMREDGTIGTVLTGQKVKRAAPGGEGLVLDHYDWEAVEFYLERFDKAFGEGGAPWPDVFFNDSYEVYGADWTGKFPEFFAGRYGYDIVAELTGPKDTERYQRAVCDYRECLADMLKENFLAPWSEWAHGHGSLVRNQSHGSPANILDLYAMVDLPECETYGRTVFDIPGLRQDPIIKANDGDPAVLKLASSAAHITGKRYTSAEALTWLTEHFRTSLSQCKPELDQAFCAGVNHIVFHGAPYSPKDVAWPGWMFYASINMSPTGSLWEDAEGLLRYVARCQAFLSAGEPDSDCYLYLPMYDAWSRFTDKPYMMFDIHGMGRTLPEAKEAMYRILSAGLDADYISDALLMREDIDKPVIVPPCTYMPVETAERLVALRKKGVPVIFVDALPSDVPGLNRLAERRKALKKAVRQFPKPVSMEKALSAFVPEKFKTESHGNLIRRRNEAGGYNYFLAMLSNHPVDGWVELATPARSAVLYDPLTGESGKAAVRTAPSGAAEVRLQLQPGQSLLLKTFPSEVSATDWKYVSSCGEKQVLADVWDISFPRSEPAVPGHFSGRTPKSWTELPVPEAKENYATARYTSAIVLEDPSLAEDWILDLGDVRESARISINGDPVDTLWSVPFRARIGKYLRPGVNTLDVDVTNLPSNRIAAMERRGEKWRIFKDANISSVTGAREFSFGDWAVDPSGLVSEVSLTPVWYDLPAPERVLAVTRRVNDYFTRKYADPTALHPFPSRHRMYEPVIWTRAVYYEGLMALYDVDPQQKYLDYALAWGEGNDWGMRYGETFTRNADNYCCGQTYLDLYRLFREEKMKEKVDACVTNILSTDESDGDWTWIDAIQMGMPVLVKEGLVSGNPACFEKAWRMYKWARDRFYNPEDGLWWRDKDFCPPYTEPNGEDCYWSRGNGWVAAALVRVLDELPASDTHRAVYEADFLSLCRAVAACQRSDGTWNVSLHDPGNYGGPEATGTSLFCYALAWGLRTGRLDGSYRPVLAKAWNALERLCIHEDGFIGYSQGSGKEPGEAQPLSYWKIPDFEDFGTGCLLLGGSEVYRLVKQEE
jgi:rhamnogalacturonyl hydrolase YesR